MIYNVLIFLTVTNFYLYAKLRAGFGAGLWNWLYLFWAALMVFLPFASRFGLLGGGRVSEVVFAFAFTWIAVVGMACVGFFFMDVCSLLARLIDFLAGTALRARFFDPRSCVPATLFLIAVIVIYSFFEAWNVRRVDVTLTTAKLPEGTERLRLVQVSDVHLGGGMYAVSRLGRIMDIVRAAEPDILLITGDLVDGDVRRYEREAELLASHGARYGAFTIMGNHEYYVGIEQALQFMKRAGLKVLRDERADVAGIAIVGLDDPAKYRKSFFEPEKLLDGLEFPADRFVLLLKHRPYVLEGTLGKFDLQLSGHTHGGQIWPFRYVAQWVNKHAQGLSFHGKNEESAVYVSNGAGFWGPPLRFLTPPEVTVIDLVRKII